MFRLVVADEAWADIRRLEGWLLEHGVRDAGELGNHIADTILSLRWHPERTPLSRNRRYRELYVTFHSNRYVIQYQLHGDAVVIGRIFHSLEDR